MNILFCLALLAQDDAPTFRANTRLVQVDVVVKSKDVPVGGLTKDDFQVLDNGKPQPISVFSVREVKPEPRVPIALPPGAVTNRPPVRGAEPVNATVMLLDSQNTPVSYQGRARLAGLKYLDHASRNEAIAIYQLDSTLKVLQSFTEDQAQLRAAFDKFHMVQSLNLQDGQDGLLAGLTGNAPNAMRAANFQRQADITTAAFATIARHLSGLPGRKKLIWISAALPLTFTLENERNGVAMQEFTNMSKQIYAPVKLLNDANVALYPVDPRGVMAPSEGAALMDPNLATMIQLADMTGGKAFYNDNDVAAGIEAAVEDTDLTYTLGFYPAEEKLDGAAHALSVKVNRSSVDVRARKSYTAETAPQPLTEKIQKATLSAWVQEPLESTDVAIIAAAAPAANKPGYYDVEVIIDVASLKLEQTKGRFTGAFALAIVPDVESKPKGLHQVIRVNLTPEKLRQTMTTGILVANQIRATNSKGKLLSDRLHLVVMDQTTGKAGSVRIPLQTLP